MMLMIAAWAIVYLVVGLITLALHVALVEYFRRSVSSLASEPLVGYIFFLAMMVALWPMLTFCTLWTKYVIFHVKKFP